MTFTVSASDVDGTVVGLRLDSGDGRIGTTAPWTIAYPSAGFYTAKVLATDNQGLTSQSSVLITVFAPRVDVSSVSPIVLTTVRKQTTGTTSVTVTDIDGKAVQGLTVFGAWSGVVSANVSAVTNSSGVATFKSPIIKTKGTVRFGVTDIRGTGHTYDPNLRNNSTNVSSP